MRDLEGGRKGQRPTREPVGQRLAFEMLQNQIVHCGPCGRRRRLLADVVEGADVRMRDLRDRPGFALEPPRNSGSSATCCARILMATMRSRRRSRAR